MAAPAEVTYTPSQSESAFTLRTIVELVRRILHADVTSIVSFSLIDETITWKAVSGFRAHVVDDQHPLVRPISNQFAAAAIESNATLVLEGIGVRADLPAGDFPVHVAEGIRDLAFTPLKARGETLGFLIVGYRTPHHFSEDEKRLLEDLAAMAAVSLDNARLLETVGAAENIWEQTFDAIDEGILVYDERNRIIRCNARAAEMIDMEPAGVIGLSFDDAFARLLGKEAADYYLAQSRNVRSAFEAQTEYGRRYLISISSVERLGGEPVSIAGWNDVTRLSEMQEQLARSRRLGSVGQLAAGVAHEINNPLAAISTCAEAIMRDLRRTGSLQTAAEEHQWSYYLEEIVRQALRCKDITRGLLDLTQQRQAKRALCDLNTLARQCARVGLQRAGSSAVAFEINLDENLGEVATDASMVRQIIDNLLSNAIDALGEQGGKVTISTLREGNRVAVEVADTGQGIPVEQLAKVFDPFFSTKGPGKGYGLGLAICAALAESLNGALTVESKEGKGSRLRLWIPRRAPEK
jgi:two-component system NtrC family sensor kinase